MNYVQVVLEWADRVSHKAARAARRMGPALAVAVVLLPLMVTRAAQAQTYTVLDNFAGSNGSNPFGGLIADSAGNLYGTTFLGGAYGYGTVYEVLAIGGESVLYNFTGGSDGALPYGTLILDAAGNLYGTAGQGGSVSTVCPFGCGVVFRVSPQGQERVFYRFTGGSDGNEPTSNLVRDTAGNLYGTTVYGGITGSCIGYGGAGLNGCGVVFKLSHGGVESVLYSFTGGSDGANPGFGLLRDAGGNLYGTTGLGGDTGSCSGFGCGVVFKVDPAGNETALYSFTGGADGWGPESGLTKDAAGDLFGTTPMGGNFSCGQSGVGCGVVFELDSFGDETTLYTFSGPDGASPAGVLARDTAGNLYGTVAEGGLHNDGAIFKLSQSGQEILLHSFTGTDGALPTGGLLGYKGFLYGTTHEGGWNSSEDGVVFRLQLK